VDNDWAAIPSNNRDLEFLQLVPISIPSFLKEHVSVNEGAKLPVDELDRYIQILEWLKKEFPESMCKSPVALDGSLTFRMANTLYDHSNKAFEAAFHSQASVKFVHRKLRKFEFTDTIKNINNPNIYLECVTALQQLAHPVASIDSEEVTERAKHVAEFLQWDTTQLRTVCDGGVVQRLDRIQFVPALHVHPNGTERNAAIRRLVPEGRLISLPEGVLRKFMDVCWSQKPFFDQELSSFVLLKIPGQGRPSADTVVMHLVYLSQRREYISLDEIPKFIQSATACYGYLRDLKLRTLTVPPNEEIWFNTDNESPGPGRDEFLESWVSTRNLCLGLDYDSGPLKIARSSLQNYIGLLKTCNVRTIRGPRAQPPPAPSDTKHSDMVLSQFQLFRHEGRFTDFTIIVQDTSLEVHKTLLCATSEYFQTMFSSQLSEAAEGKVDWTDIGLEAATRVVDFFYTGELTPVKRSDDPTDEIELLLVLLLASDRYMLPALKTKVERALWSNRYIRPETVMTILKCAIDYSANKLRGICEEYYAENLDVIQRES